MIPLLREVQEVLEYTVDSKDYIIEYLDPKYGIHTTFYFDVENIRYYIDGYFNIQYMRTYSGSKRGFISRLLSKKHKNKNTDSLNNLEQKIVDILKEYKQNITEHTLRKKAKKICKHIKLSEGKDYAEV